MSRTPSPVTDQPRNGLCFDTDSQGSPQTPHSQNSGSDINNMNNPGGNRHEDRLDNLRRPSGQDYTEDDQTSQSTIDRGRGDRTPSGEFNSERYQYRMSQQSIILETNSSLWTRNGESHIPSIVHAAIRGSILDVRVCLEANCELAAEDQDGYTALHRAIEGGHTEIVIMLVNALKSKELFGFNYLVTRAGDTPLLLAARSGNLDILNLLKQNRYDSQQMNKRGETLFYFAMLSGDVQRIKSALEEAKSRGQVPNFKTENGDTVLHLGVTTNDRELIEACIDAGIDPLSQNAQGYTALHLAVRKNDPEIVERIKDYGPEAVRIRAKDGSTPVSICENNIRKKHDRREDFEVDMRILRILKLRSARHLANRP